MSVKSVVLNLDLKYSVDTVCVLHVYVCIQWRAIMFSRVKMTGENKHQCVGLKGETSWFYRRCFLKRALCFVSPEKQCKCDKIEVRNTKPPRLSLPRFWDNNVATDNCDEYSNILYMENVSNAGLQCTPKSKRLAPGKRGSPLPAFDAL